MRTYTPLLVPRRAVVFAAVVLLAACGSPSNSETGPAMGPAAGSTGAAGSPAGSGGSGGGSGGTGGSGGGAATPATGGSGGSGSPATGGGPGGGPRADAGAGAADVGGPAGDAAATAGACPAMGTLTLAVHVVMDATWPSTTSAAAGTDKIHLWNLTKVKVNGTELSGNETRSCGTVLPPFNLTGAGQLVTGGQRVHLEIPHAVWDAPSIPRLRSQGRLSGWNRGDMLAIEGTVALIGLTLPDPMVPWPDSYSALQAVDADGDGKPGFTAVPRLGSGFVQPPTGIGLLGSAPSADRVYVATRTVLGLEGTFSSCTDLSGAAKVTLFDSHVVGCHVRNGGECTANQADFVDQNRTIYKIGTATFTARQVPETASCADVRAALP